MADSSSAKRRREDHPSPPPASDAPESATDAKRLRTVEIVQLFDDVEDDDVSNPTGDGDLASVMRSLEEEISAPAAVPVAVDVSEDLSTPPTLLSNDLGYLLEASDDELGLPPATESGTASPSDEEAPVFDGGDAFSGQIWEFEDGGFDGVADFTSAGAYDDGYYDGALFSFGMDEGSMQPI